MMDLEINLSSMKDGYTSNRARATLTVHLMRTSITVLRKQATMRARYIKITEALLQRITYKNP